MTDQPEPNAQDRENARRRNEIAARQNAEYEEAMILALRTLGPGWKPWMKLCLIPSDHRQTGDATPVATVYKVYRGEQKLSDNSMFIRRMPDGRLAKARSHEELFGELLNEPHPNKTMEFKGRQVPVGRYELAWGALEEYHPRSADQLARTRATRERNKAARDEQAFRDGNPLFTTWAERNAQEEEQDGGHSGP